MTSFSPTTGMPDTLDLEKRSEYLAPLSRFYEQSNEKVPLVTFLDGQEVPEPYRHLLVHQSDMTPRLTDYHEAELGLRVLRKHVGNDEVEREVVLYRLEDNAPVEFGAIRIRLDLLPAPVAEEVRAGVRPLGGILQKAAFPHFSAPRAYFAIRADSLVASLLETQVGERLYGRCNILSVSTGEVFAEIVEVLPCAIDPLASIES